MEVLMLYFIAMIVVGKMTEEYDVKHIQAIQTHREGNIISAYFGR